MSQGKMKYVEYAVLLVVAVALSFGLVALIGPRGTVSQTRSRLDEIKARGTLRAGIPIAGLPLATVDESGEIIGWMVDVSKEMATALEVELEIVDTVDANRIPFLQAGQIDFGIASNTLPRHEVVGFTRPVALGAQAGVTLAGSGIESYDDLVGKKIALVTGATGDIIATKRFPDNEMIRVDTQSTAIRAVETGQADVAIGDWSTMYPATLANPDLIMLPALRWEPVGFIVPRDDYAWREWMNDFFNDLYVSGVSTCGCGEELWEQWFTNEPVNPEVLRLY